MGLDIQSKIKELDALHVVPHKPLDFLFAAKEAWPEISADYHRKESYIEMLEEQVKTLMDGIGSNFCHSSPHAKTEVLRTALTDCAKLETQFNEKWHTQQT